ncbi:hypothetical protein TVAG_012440 [Trichomonas vaginalis G3]|uniref:receptor protein-tyrosine kinase n=1 Tax=Trichomonas vaginalis (strain ATCC PRA-98 / G3) TaxID=412133 RepID=A2E8Z4_TRIV3|nr:glycine-rich protein family [Trichomonas vaginalis G3]EAY10878.1 hypothetical protein TVAG_012440 [Trichomonas vaginalis G3]KAI5482925.1 glycine-rich protein family [Trichomonas vaginalis G3]|eukprot:XP_001323101.1 hypothetical protein [Trichomonas vaginalis G3]
MKKGTYLLEVWGPHAGSRIVDEKGYGGYSYALVYIPKDQIIHLYIGGMGEYYFNDNRLTYKAFNGGGAGCIYGGSGATDFRIDTNLNSRFLIAGGGAYDHNQASSSANTYDIGGGIKNTPTDAKFFGNGKSYSAVSECKKFKSDSPTTGYYVFYSGGGCGLYGGDAGKGGSGFVYLTRHPSSIRDINEIFVIDGRTYSGLNYFIDGRAQISLYSNADMYNFGPRRISVFLGNYIYSQSHILAA